MTGEKTLDTRGRRYERVSKLGEWGRSNDDQKRNATAHNRLELIWLIPNSPIVRDRDPIPLADFTKPEFVGGVVCEMIVMSLDLEAGYRDDFWESFP